MINSKLLLFSEIEGYPMSIRLRNFLEHLLAYSKVKIDYNMEEQCYEIGIFKDKKLYYGIRMVLLPTKILFYFVDHFIQLGITYICENNIGKRQNISYNTIFNYEYHRNNMYCQYRETSRYDSNQNEIKRYIWKKYGQQEFYETIQNYLNYVVRIEESYTERKYYIYCLSEEELMKQKNGKFYLPYPSTSIDVSTLREVQKRKM